MRRAALVTGIAAAAIAFWAAPAGATFPGQNGQIVYVDNGEVMTMDANGSGQTALTTSGNNSDPAFSAAGTQIAYAHRSGNHATIDVMNADGTGNRVLTSGHFDTSPAFSPNGRKVTFSRALYKHGYNFAGIFTVRVDGTNVRQLTQSKPVFSDEQSQPSYSPDGTTIVFQDLFAEDGGISAVDANGKHARSLTSERIEPSFSPSGKRILFTELFGAEPQIGIMNARGGHAHDFTGNKNRNFNYHLPSFSPDATKIVFAGGITGVDIYTMNPDGTGATKLTDDGTSESPDWGPLPFATPAG